MMFISILIKYIYFDIPKLFFISNEFSKKNQFHEKWFGIFIFDQDKYWNMLNYFLIYI
jgi:hypothetical protein